MLGLRGFPRLDPLRNGQLGLILLDIQLPGMSGLDALGSFRERHPAIPVVVLSASENRDDVLRAIDGGAMGFIPKSLRISLKMFCREGGRVMPSLTAKDKPLAWFGP